MILGLINQWMEGSHNFQLFDVTLHECEDDFTVSVVLFGLGMFVGGIK